MRDKNRKLHRYPYNARLTSYPPECENTQQALDLSGCFGDIPVSDDLSHCHSDPTNHPQRQFGRTQVFSYTPETTFFCVRSVPAGVRRQRKRSVSGAGQVCRRRSRWQGLTAQWHVPYRRYCAREDRRNRNAALSVAWH